MKLVPTVLTALLGLFLVAPEAGAREGGGHGGGGGARGGGGGGGGGGAKRSPMTGSKVQRPAAKPQPKPAARPQQKPAARPDPKPATKPAERPSAKKPDAKPGKAPDRRPDGTPGGPGDKRPSVDRPDQSKPSTLPGMVSYPNRPDKGKPGQAGRPGGNDRPGQGDNRPGDSGQDRAGQGDNRPGQGVADRERPSRGGPSIVDRGDKVKIGGGDKVNIGRGGNNVHINNINVGRKNVGLNRPGTLPAGNRNWDANKWGGNNSVWGNRVNIGNDVNINVNNRYRNNNNFACRPNYWGGRPWWGAGNYHGWHHGHWGYGWNSKYYHNHWWFDDDDDFAQGFMWGIAAWSLGSMVYDMGYQSYKNPYPAPPVQNSYVTYTQPITTAAAANPPGDEQTAATAETKSDEALERSRSAFKQGDYLAASKAVDEAIGYTPDDVTLHEYRALVFFALGKYGDAAGVLNPVLASGPGWSWETMSGFYGDSSSYNDQLKKLEAYVKSSGKADGRFLLGYHYMVCGHMDKAHEQFAKAVEMQPADTISRQLRDLTGDSIPDGGEDTGEAPAPPPPVPSEKLVGTWTSENSAGKVTFSMKENGDFIWNYSGGESPTELKGTYGLNDKGLLVLTSEDTQMVSAVTMDGDRKMKFMLVGAPDGDPGLDFTKG